MQKIMKIYSTQDCNKKISESLGLVKGNTVRARHIGVDIVSTIKGIFGGEIKGYVKALDQSRDIAITKMIAEAESMGADAVVGVRFATSNIVSGASEILVYGTAVKFE